jgi:hypothetical protein
MLQRDKFNIDLPQSCKSYCSTPSPYQVNPENAIDYLNKKVATLESKVECLCSDEKKRAISPKRKQMLLKGREPRVNSFSKSIHYK